jgi:uncharacterized protein YgiM (DUF1202 family)
MATVVIQNSCVAGAMAGLMQGRYVGSFVPTDYSTIATIARAIANEFITENAAASSPIADADNAQAGVMVQAVTQASIANSGAVSVTAADYINYAKQIYAASKEGIAQLV